MFLSSIKERVLLVPLPMQKTSCLILLALLTNALYVSIKSEIYKISLTYLPFPNVFIFFPVMAEIMK